MGTIDQLIRGYLDVEKAMIEAARAEGCQGESGGIPEAVRAVLANHGELILSAIMVATRVERETLTMGVSEIEKATRSRRGRKH